MKTKTLPILTVLLLTSCASILPGNDPVVVRAEQATQLAFDTFNLVEKTEFDTYAALKATSPSTAAQVRTFVNSLRRQGPEWLASARTLTHAYKANRSPENAASLSTAIAVLTSATLEANKYIAMMATTHAWLSYQLANHIGERK